MLLTIIFVSIATIALYIALRIYINAFLIRETQFNAILNKLQKEIDALIVEMNRVTDRNTTIFEKQIQTLTDLLKQSKSHITVLSKHNQKRGAPKLYYTPQEVIQRVQAKKKREDSAEERQRHIIALAERGLTTEEIARQVGVSISEVEAFVAIEIDAQ